MNKVFVEIIDDYLNKDQIEDAVLRLSELLLELRHGYGKKSTPVYANQLLTRYLFTIRDNL